MRLDFKFTIDQSSLVFIDIIQRCFGAASANDRLDVVIRDMINASDIPGPRYLANDMEIAKRDGDLVPGITAYGLFFTLRICLADFIIQVSSRGTYFNESKI